MAETPAEPNELPDDQSPVLDKHELTMKKAKVEMLIRAAEKRMNSHHKQLAKLRNVDEYNRTKTLLMKLTSKILSDN
jgi:hypothetical protein